MSLDWWSRRLTDLGLPDGAIARVLDAEGQVVARYPPDARELGQQVNSVTDLGLPPGISESLFQHDGAAGPELVLWTPLLESAGTPVANLSLTIPLRDLYAAANYRLWRNMAILLVGLLATFALAHLAVQRAIARPLQRLMDATEALAQGRYAPAGSATGVTELTELARRFDQMARTRQQAEARVRDSEENLAITLLSIGDAVMATDIAGAITRMNPAAERLTGWMAREAIGKPLGEVFRIVRADTREPAKDPVTRVLHSGEIVGLANHTTLLARDGREYQISDSAAPIRDASGAVVGVVLVFSDVTESYEVRQQLEASEQRFRTLTALSSDWYWEQDAQFRLTLLEGHPGHPMVRDRGLHLGDVRWHNALMPADDPRWLPHRQALERREEFRDFEYARIDSTGAVCWMSVSGTPMFDEGGRFCGYRGVGKDITARKQAEEELRIAAIAFESQEGMFVTDPRGAILRSNRAFTGITGYPASEVVGSSPRILSSGRHDTAFFRAMFDSLATTGQRVGEIWNRHRNGDLCLHFMTITAVHNTDGQLTHYVGALSDITQKAQAAREIEHLAFYDALTHLPNRRLVMDRLQQAFAASARTGRQGALLCLDLDHFKSLNDTLGHDMGDVLLQQVAQRLQACVREGDTVARLGGDEFLVLLEDLGQRPEEAAEQTQSISEKILSALNQPYQLAMHMAHSTTSIGAVTFHGQARSVEELVKYADLAMYAAKSAGRNVIRFFDPRMQAAVAARVAMENDLRSALAEGQFRLHYQVQVDGNGDALGAEVLIRWQHPERGTVPPGDFIGLAEETGLILPIGQWVLRTACAQLTRWQADPLRQHLTLAVNVSARQFHQPDFIEQVCAVLGETRAPADRLKLELTESLALDNVNETIDKMMALKAIGLRFSMDDFGTGQSSLSYLTRLPLDQLKIDQSFVHNFDQRQTDALMVQTIIGMAQSLGLEVIAEGVETQAQRAFLARQGCTMCQGYLFGRPEPLDAFEASLQTPAH